jgi:uncharacterized protein (DUF2062 family)
MNRHSVAKAVAIAIFIGWTPLLGHMLMAAALSIWLEANLPLAVALVWFSNPLTMPFLFYLGYKLGTILLQVPYTPISVELSFHWMVNHLMEIWKPLFLGCFLLGLIAGIIGAFLVLFIWRLNIQKRWRERHVKG